MTHSRQYLPPIARRVLEPGIPAPPIVNTMEALRYMGQRDRLYLPFMMVAEPLDHLPECLMAGDARKQLYYAYCLHHGVNGLRASAWHLPRLLPAATLAEVYVELTLELPEAHLLQWRPILAPKIDPEHYRETVLMPLQQHSAQGRNGYPVLHLLPRQW